MKANMKKWVEKNWGKRCKKYNVDCACCKAWLCYDYLFQYSFKPEQEIEFEVKKLVHGNWKSDKK